MLASDWSTRDPGITAGQVLFFVVQETGFPLSLGDLGDLGDQKYFYQWNSEKRK